MKQRVFTMIILLSFFAISSITAQKASKAPKMPKATISSFLLNCKDSKWDGKKEYVMWEDDFTNNFVYVNSKQRSVNIRTVDTLFSYAQLAIAQKLGINLEKQEVEDGGQQMNTGMITGFPQERVKKVARDGYYDKIVEVQVSATPEQPSFLQVGTPGNKRYQVEMTVLIKVYDQDGSEIERYKNSAKLDEPKSAKQERGASKNPLTGNELFNLFAKTIDGALTNKL